MSVVIRKTRRAELANRSVGFILYVDPFPICVRGKGADYILKRGDGKMRLFAFASVSICAAGLLSAAANASMTNAREWADVHGFVSNSASQLWYGTAGVNGPLLSSAGTSWRASGQPYEWPMIGPLVDIGSYGGAAGPATFNGMWGRPGSVLDAVMVLAPQAPTWTTGLTVNSELIANGMLGDGVTITVLAKVDGVTSNLGTVTLANSADARIDFFALGGGLTQMNAGDSYSVVIGNNGSFLYDHVNFNAWLTVPGPGAVAILFGAAGMLKSRRRR
jgi:hypothetical protein